MRASILCASRRRRTALAAALSSCVIAVACGDSGDDASSGGQTTCEPGSTVACYSGPAATEGVGACIGGQKTCSSDGKGYGPCVGEVVPTEESCATPDDDDCDGETNEEGADCGCTPGAQEACYSGPDGTLGVGVCVGGTHTCKDDATWGPCTGEVVPTADDCENVLDEDCSGLACSAAQWNVRVDGDLDQSVHGLAVDSKGNLIVVGGDQRIADFGEISVAPGYVTKLDPAGKIVWAAPVYCQLDNTAVAVADDDSIFIGGRCQDFGMIGSDTGDGDFIAKLDKDGVLLWDRIIKGYVYATVRGLAVDQAGDVIAIGDTKTFPMDFGYGPVDPVGGYDIFACKLRGDTGETLWGKIYGDTSDQFGYGVATHGTDIYLAGKFAGALDFGGAPLSSSGAPFDGFLTKLDAQGAVVFSKRFGGIGDDTVAGVAADSTGVLIAGNFVGQIDFGGGPLTAAGSSDVFLAKLDENGGHLWSKQFGGATGTHDVAAIAADADGDLLVTGTFDGDFDLGGKALAAASTTNGFVGKFDPEGNHLWSKRFGETGLTGGTALASGGPDHIVALGASVTGSVNFGLGVLTAAAGSATDGIVVAFAP